MNNKPKLFESLIIIYLPYLTVLSIGQCDACPPGILLNANKKACKGNSYLYTPFHTLPLDNTFNAVYGSHLSSNPIVLNKNALDLIQYFDEPKTLETACSNWRRMYDEKTLDNIFKQLIQLNLIHPQQYSDVQYTESTSLLTAALHLTSSCNLSCDYCYLPPNPSEMSLSTGYIIIDSVFQSAVTHHYSTLKLKYTGGEPLARISEIQSLHNYAKILAEKYAITLKGVILSNGTLLTPEIIKTLKSLNLRLMISLDGLNDFHDSHRHFRDGSGSFKKVSYAIDLAIAENLIPDISVTVSSRNIKGLPELMHWISDRKLPFSLNFYRENDFSIKYTDMRLDDDKIINGMLAAYKVIESNLPEHSLLTALADRANLAVPHLRPCSVGHSYMVFDGSGNIFKCQMQMDKLLGNIYRDDPLKIIRKEGSGIRNVKVEEKEECNSCNWKYWCAGGCPIQAYRAAGRYDVKSPNCTIYKLLFPEIIRLEGLRMLKYFC